jgi:hypothetical protein
MMARVSDVIPGLDGAFGYGVAMNRLRCEGAA